MKYIRMNRKQTHIAVALFAATLIAAGGGIALARQNRGVSVPSTTTQHVSGQHGNSKPDTADSEMSHVTPLPAASVSGDPTTATQLVYLIEEEKLAHDVYQVLYDTWGSQVFRNIVKSEANHQSEVLAVMQNRNIADPRSSSLGVFTNKDLQALYTKLVAQGKQSQTEAYKVGVAIEELDIADIKKDLASLNSADTDVKATMEQLLAGSERHLAAFNRQLTR
ncbi:DUF2202 domain-containing protein [Candidatus Saccharibacteria bacterium]|nr:DUF2202 domain-containing protein [Candidatus Saccharibacteria bacterium]